MSEVIDVLHSCDGDWHKFTSPHIPGFYLVAEQDDLEEAYAEIPEAIAALVTADFGVEVRITLQTAYSDYSKALPQSYRPSLQHYLIEKLAA